MSRHVRTKTVRIKEMEDKIAELKIKEEIEKLKMAIKTGANSPLMRKYLTQIK